MEKDIKKLIISVILTTALFFISIPLWNYSSHHKGVILASGYGDLAISIDIGDFKTLVAIEDERALEYIEPTSISFRNRNSYAKEYDILFLVSKNSTINYKDIKVSLDGNIYALNKIEVMEDDTNYYFLLKKDGLDAYSQKNVDARIWLDEDTKITDNMSLTSNFITR